MNKSSTKILFFTSILAISLLIVAEVSSQTQNRTPRIGSDAIPFCGTHQLIENTAVSQKTESYRRNTTATDTNHYTISGVVITIPDRGHAHAKLYFAGNANHQILSTITDSTNGQYNISLPSGRYQMVVLQEGYYLYTDTAFDVRSERYDTLEILQTWTTNYHFPGVGEYLNEGLSFFKMFTGGGPGVPAWRAPSFDPNSMPIKIYIDQDSIPYPEADSIIMRAMDYFTKIMDSAITFKIVSNRESSGITFDWKSSILYAGCGFMGGWTVNYHLGIITRASIDLKSDSDCLHRSLAIHEMMHALGIIVDLYQWESWYGILDWSSIMFQGGTLNPDDSTAMRYLYRMHHFPKDIYKYDTTTIKTPQLIVAWQSIDFGDVAIKDTTSESVLLFNPSLVPVIVDSIYNGTEWFSVFPKSFTIPSNDSIRLTVSFAPNAIYHFTDTLIFRFDSSNNSIRIPLKGNSPPPVMQVMPFYYNPFAGVPSDSTGEGLLTIKNSSINFLSIDSLYTNTKYFEVDNLQAHFRIRIGDSMNVKIRFKPHSSEQYQQYLDTLFIINNSPTNPYKKVLWGSSLGTGVADGSQSIPKTFFLSQNYPNPFNSSTIFNFQLPTANFVTLKVFDVLGREVATLVNEKKERGEYEVEWNADKVTSGVYIYQLTAGTQTITRKTILVK